MAGELDTGPRLADPDAIYAALVEAHRGLDEPTSALLNARLVLLLANQVGDDAVVLAAIRAARQGIEGA